MVEKEFKNKSLDELVNEDKKLTGRTKHRDERDERRPPRPREGRSRSRERRRGKYSC